MKKIIFVIAAIIFTCSAYPQQTPVKSTDSVFANITAAQAHDTVLAHLDDPWFVILDVRTASEYSPVHIENAVNIDFYNAQFNTILDSLNKNKTYLIHCASGSRSAQTYTKMQNLHFSRVYNMTGGINAWKTSYPTVATFAPRIGLLCDSVVYFHNVVTSDTTTVTITNSANAVLTIDSITSLSQTEFQTDFDTAVLIRGARDYSFKIIYNPLDTVNDSIVFTIWSNGGLMNLYLVGNAIIPTVVKENNNDAVQIIRMDNDGKYFVKSGEKEFLFSAEIYDMSSRKVFAEKISDQNRIIDISSLPSGIYVLHIFHNSINYSFKLIR